MPTKWAFVQSKKRYQYFYSDPLRLGEHLGLGPWLLPRFLHVQDPELEKSETLREEMDRYRGKYTLPDRFVFLLFTQFQKEEKLESYFPIAVQGTSRTRQDIQKRQAMQGALDVLPKP